MKKKVYSKDFDYYIDEYMYNCRSRICKLDRFARTAIEGVQTVRELFEKGIKVHILNMGLIENTLDVPFQQKNVPEAKLPPWRHLLKNLLFV